MTDHAPTRHRTAAPDLGRALARLAAPLRRYLEAYTGRRAAERLLRLDDRLLADIGLERADVLAALAAPSDVDPIAVLAARRRERQAASSGSATSGRLNRARAPRTRS